MENQFRMMLGYVDTVSDDSEGTITVKCPDITPIVIDKTAKGKADDTHIIELEEDGVKTKTQIKSKDTITAIYWEYRSNVSRPDIHEQELVFIFSHANSDTFYWFAPGRNDSVRFNEHYRIHCMNEKIVIKDIKDDNTYFVEVDTRDGKKRIHMHTSKSDGEAHEYDFMIDTIKSTVELKDETGNLLRLESDTPRWFMTNNQDCSIDLTEQDCFIKAPRQFIIDTPLFSMCNTSGSGFTHFSANQVHFDVSNNFTVTSSTITLNGLTSIKEVMTGHIVSESGSSLGSVTPYLNSGATIDIDKGTGKAGTSPSSTDSSQSAGIANPRHCSAEEQIYEAFELLFEAIDEALIDNYNNLVAITEDPEVTISASQLDESDKTAILQKVIASIMQKNTGE